MKRFFGQANLLKNKIEILSPFNTIVLPDIIYTTRITKPQEDLLRKLKVEKMISTIYNKSNLFEKQSQQLNEKIEQANQETQVILESLTNKKSKKNFKRKLMYDHNLVSVQKDYFLFDPEFRRLINNRYFNQDADYCFDQKVIQKYDDIYFKDSDIYGSLNQISFHKFQMDHQNTQMIHSFGMRPVKILEEQDLSEALLREWIFNKYNDFIEKTQAKLDQLSKNEVDDRKRNSLTKTIETYQSRIDETSENFMFGNLEQIQQDLIAKKFKLVSYENHFTIEDAVYDMSQEEFDKCKEISIEINGYIRALMVKSNFVMYDKFLDLNGLATEKYFIHWYHNLIGILCSKKVLNEAGIIYLNKETNLLQKLNFLKIVLKEFQTEYIKEWTQIEQDVNKKNNFDPQEQKQSIKEMYEQYKEFSSHMYSSTKKEIIKKTEEFLQNRKLNEKVQQIVKEELTRFRDLNEQESDYQNTKNYLDLITKLPFNIQTNDQTDLKKAKKLLEDSHFGMDDVKTRILEFLAIGKLKENFVSNKVLCLLGPPGVGKTSIAKSIAECLGRKFQRIALGGENDVSVLKGHRRTYVGSYPGKILNALKLAESENPVILLDEIDKIGRSSHKGNVQDVLLEILDPMQNSEFNDHYLEAPLDLSKVLFLCSANMLDSSTISSALYDRLEVIELSGYTQEEKLKIFNDYLLKKLINKVGLDKYNIELTFPDEVVFNIIDKYARESGVRSLEKKVQIILEKYILDFLQEHEDFEDYSKDKEKSLKHQFSFEQIQKYLGPRVFHNSTIIHQDEDQIGYALGLGYSSIGGSVLSIEVIELPEDLKDIRIETKDDKKNPQQKSGSIQVTGSLGTVMKESVEIAYSFAKNFLYKLDPSNQSLEDKNLHIHFPEGASKKDGPSAGITITSAILSLALNQKYNNDYAMTGEISLNGKVMKIGGLREKVLAAKREDIKNIIVPKSNRGDIQKLKDYIKDEIIQLIQIINKDMLTFDDLYPIGQQVFEEDQELQKYAYFFNKKNQMLDSMVQNIQKYKGGLNEFTQGYHYYGVNQEKDIIFFREWLPNAKEVYLVGDFNNWNGKQYKFEKDIYGVFQIKFPKNCCPLQIGQLYKLYILNNNNQWVYRNQAYTQRVVQDQNTHLFTNQFILPQQTYISNSPKGKRKLKIYEAHIGMSEEFEGIASFKDFTNNRLQYIKDLGYNTIQLMAIQEHAYYGSFGYHVTNFFAVSSKYGSIQDFRELVQKAHDLDLLVLLDVVYSHASSNEDDGIGNMDGSGHQYFHSGDKGNHSQWDSKIFDIQKIEVLRFLLSNVRFWIEIMDLDGFRFDGITSILYEHHGINYGFTGNYSEYFNDYLSMESLAFLTLANYVMRQLKQNSISIAEDVSGLPTLCRPIKYGGIGFDYRLNMYVPDMWIKLLKEQKDEDWKVGDIIYNLKNKRQYEDVINYSESHDQALVGDKTISMRLFEEQIYNNMSIHSEETIQIFRGMCLHKLIRFVTFLFGDGYLNFMGNEFGHPEWIDFPREGNGWSYKYCRRQWSLIQNKDLRFVQLFNWDLQMHQLDKDFDLIGQGNQLYIRYHYDNQIIILEKKGLLIIFNFNAHEVIQKVIQQL